MSWLYPLLAILGLVGAAWYKIRSRLNTADRMVAKSKVEQQKAEVKAEVATGEAEVASAERDAAVTAVENVHRATEATNEVNHEAALADDHPDRAAARAAAALRARRAGDIVSGELPRRVPAARRRPPPGDH